MTKIEDLMKEYKELKERRDYPFTISFKSFLLCKILEELRSKK